MVKAQKYMRGEDSAHTFLMEGTIGVGRNHKMGGGHCTYFVDGRTIRVGTPHNIERKLGNITELGGRVGLFVAGNNTTLWPNLQVRTCKISSQA